MMSVVLIQLSIHAILFMAIRHAPAAASPTYRACARFMNIKRFGMSKRRVASLCVGLTMAADRVVVEIVNEFFSEHLSTTSTAESRHYCGYS